MRLLITANDAFGHVPPLVPVIREIPDAATTRANAALLVPPEQASAADLRATFARALADPCLAAGAERARRALAPTCALADRIERAATIR